MLSWVTRFTAPGLPPEKGGRRLYIHAQLGLIGLHEELLILASYWLRSCQHFQDTLPLPMSAQYLQAPRATSLHPHAGILWHCHPFLALHTCKLLQPHNPAALRVLTIGSQRSCWSWKEEAQSSHHCENLTWPDAESGCLGVHTVPLSQ